MGPKPTCHEGQLLESRRLAVADDADVSDFWVFGYGSLIYNPIIDHSQRAIASIMAITGDFVYGQKSVAGRQLPWVGIVARSWGSCKGVAFRLNPQNAIAELDLLWRREMMTMAYQPRLISLHTELA